MPAECPCGVPSGVAPSRAFGLSGLLWDEIPPLDTEAARRADLRALEADGDAAHGGLGGSVEGDGARVAGCGAARCRESGAAKPLLL